MGNRNSRQILHIIPAQDWYAAFNKMATSEQYYTPLVCWALLAEDGSQAITGMVAAEKKVVPTRKTPIFRITSSKPSWQSRLKTKRCHSLAAVARPAARSATVMSVQQSLWRWLRRPYWKPLVLVLGLTCANLIQAGEVTEATVDYTDGRFILHTDVLIKAPTSQVRAILTRYESLPQVHGGIKVVEILALAADGQTRMRVKSQVCMLLICLNYQWVQTVRSLPSGDIVTQFDPEASDFREGWVRYRLLPEGEHTRLLMDARLTPDFWFPPIIGPWLIERKLRNEALATAWGVERLAQ